MTRGAITIKPEISIPHKYGVRTYHEHIILCNLVEEQEKAFVVRADGVGNKGYIKIVVDKADITEVTFPENVKRYEEWKGSLNEFLNIGDYVDEDIVSHFINVLPPATLRSNLIQIGEAYSSIDGRATYPTLRKDEHGWAYAGNCFRGEKEQPTTVTA